MTRGAAVELRRDLGEARACGRHLQDRRVGRDVDGALDCDGGRARSERIGRVRVAIRVDSGHRDEQVAGLDGARVVRDPAHLDAAVTLDRRPGHAARQVLEPHARLEDTGLDNRGVIADIGGHRFAWGGRTYVMGIVNVTPDSFSGGGPGDERSAAGAQGLRMVAEGADMLDVGGESTRPGHVPVAAAEEIERTLEVVRRLAQESGVPVSIDTYKFEVAEAAVAAGATMVNDVWGLARSPALAQLAPRHRCGLVVRHNQDSP